MLVPVHMHGDSAGADRELWGAVAPCCAWAFLGRRLGSRPASFQVRAARDAGAAAILAAAFSVQFEVLVVVVVAVVAAGAAAVAVGGQPFEWLPPVNHPPCLGREGEIKGRHRSVKVKDKKVVAQLGSLTTCKFTSRGLKNT